MFEIVNGMSQIVTGKAQVKNNQSGDGQYTLLIILLMVRTDENTFQLEMYQIELI